MGSSPSRCTISESEIGSFLVLVTEKSVLKSSVPKTFLLFLNNKKVERLVKFGKPYGAVY